jgi:hypothetical protein
MVRLIPKDGNGDFMSKVLTKLRERKAATIVIDLVVFVIIVAMVLAFATTTVSALVTAFRLGNFSQELARSIEISGDTAASSVNARISDLKDQYGITPSITYSRSGHINLNESFKVTLRTTIYLEIGGVVKLPVELSSVASGASEVYWKT